MDLERRVNINRKQGFINDYIITGDITTIFIVNKKGIRFEVLIDTDDLSRLIEADLKWHVAYDSHTNEYYVKSTKFYPSTNIRKYHEKNIMLHRFIMSASEGVVVDHHSHNRLDNRKENLFVTEYTNNSTNRKGANKNNKTGYRNVNYMKKDNVYWVQFMKKGKRYRWIYSADQFKEACEFAEKKRKELFGKFAGNG